MTWYSNREGANENAGNVLTDGLQEPTAESSYTPTSYEADISRLSFQTRRELLAQAAILDPGHPRKELVVAHSTVVTNALAAAIG